MKFQIGFLKGAAQEEHQTEDIASHFALFSKLLHSNKLLAFMWIGVLYSFYRYIELDLQ